MRDVGSDAVLLGTRERLLDRPGDRRNARIACLASLSATGERFAHRETRPCGFGTCKRHERFDSREGGLTCRSHRDALGDKRLHLQLHILDRRFEALLAAREMLVEDRPRETCARADRLHAHPGIAHVIGHIDDPAEQQLAIGALAWLWHLAVACPLPASRPAPLCPEWIGCRHRLYRRFPWDASGAPGHLTGDA